MEEGKDVINSGKKRHAGREISRDNPDLEDDGLEPEMGTFKRASDEVLANRRIVKVRRQQQPPASSVNPFAGINLVAPVNPNDKTDRNAPHNVPPEKPFLNKQSNANESERPLKGKETENGAAVDGENAIKEANAPVRKNRSDPASEDVEKDKSNLEKEVALSKAFEKEDETELQEHKGEGSENPEKEVGKENKEEGSCNTVKEFMGETQSTKEAEKDVTTGVEKQESDNKDKAETVASFGSFQQLSNNQNAFTGLAGTGFSGSSFSFGSSVAKEGSLFGSESGSVFGKPSEKSAFPSFGFGSSTNGSSSLQLFGAEASETTKDGGSSKPSMQEVLVETGEENEKVVFNADAILYEYLDGGWKERGKGELRVNVSTSGTEKARLVMRAKGNYRLILNSSLYPDMSLKNMDKKGVTFACVNSTGEGKGGLVTFALKFKEGSIMEEFREIVTTYKGKKDASVLKTPENSPKASGD